MAKVTKRKLLNLFSYLASLMIAWLTGATSIARDSGQEVTSPVESSSWQYSRSGLKSTTSYLLPLDESLDPSSSSAVLERTQADDAIVVASYGGESPAATKGSGKPIIELNPFVPRTYGELVFTAPQERRFLQQFLNSKAGVVKQANNCERRVKKGVSPYICYAEVLDQLERRLAREADRGSTVAKQALPVVRQMAEEVRNAQSGQAAIAAVQRGIGKVQQISLVRSQDTVIVNLQQQQRAVLAETLQAVEISLAKSVSI